VNWSRVSEEKIAEGVLRILRPKKTTIYFNDEEESMSIAQAALAVVPRLPEIKNIIEATYNLAHHSVGPKDLIDNALASIRPFIGAKHD